MKNIAAIVAFVVLVSFGASAQTPRITGSEFQTQTPGKTVVGVVDMCINLSTNQAVPCGTPGAVPTSPGSTNYSLAVTPTVAASSHASGSAVGGLQTLPVFRASSAFSGIVNNVKWTWKTGANVTAVTVYLFLASPTGSTCTDAVAFSLAAADVPKLIAGSPFTLTPTVVGAGSTISTAFVQSPISVKNADATPGQNIYACVVVNATVTPAANDAVLDVAGLTD